MTRDPVDEHTALDALDGYARALADAAEGAPAWLVGGVVRDALVGRPILDVDIVVEGDAGAVARRWAKATGGSPFPLSDKFGCWRVTAADDGPQIDVCPLRDGDLGTDLRARDFTVNALAVSPDERRIEDHVGGLQDLREGRLRVVSERSFADDPLRLLRLARIGQAFGLEPDDTTRSLARASAPRATEPAGERIFTELAALLECGAARRAILRLDDSGALDVLLPQLAACKAMRQGPYHQLDVFAHTLAVLDNAEDIAAHPAFYFGGSCEGLDAGRTRFALFAALCHDLGKPVSRSETPDGLIRFVGHESTGVQIVNDLCDGWSTSGAFRSGLKLLVATHLDLGFRLHGAQDDRALYGFARATDPHAPEAVVLSLADRLATGGPKDQRKWMRRHHEFANRAWAWVWNEIEHGRPVPMLDGLEIADAAGIEPGPELRGYVEALAEAQAVGDVTDRDGAVELIRSLAASPTLDD